MGVSDRSVPDPQTFEDPGSIQVATATTFPVVSVGFDPTVTRSQGPSGWQRLRYFLSGPLLTKYAKNKLRDRAARAEGSEYGGG